MKRKMAAVLLALCFVITLLVGCGNSDEAGKDAPKTQEVTDEEKDETEESKSSKAYKNSSQMTDFKQASDQDVKAFMTDQDDKTVLVDARTQEGYAGWALEGAAHGGHLKNAVLFSSRWLDCEYTEESPREAYLERAMKDQGISKDKNIIVYDYAGKQAAHVAQYFTEQGFTDVSVYQAKKMIDAGEDLVSYKNYQMYLPTEIVKNISDVKTGKEKELSKEAKAIVGDQLDKVVLVDVGWGNAKSSTYFSVGHVPGAVHINTDSYERPRVYVPEKRSDYAKEWRLIPLEEFRDDVCTQYGITKDSIVIVTGSSIVPQARLSFMLRSLGVEVYAMSGGLMAWSYNGYELDTDEKTLVVPESVESFGSNGIANPNEIIWMEEVKEILSGKKAGQIVDNRGKEEWDGTYSGYSYHDLAGRIEGTIWCPYSDPKEGGYFVNVDNTPRTQEELMSHLQQYKVDPSKTVAFFCGDSWAAAHIAYVCQSNDFSNIKQWGQGWIPWSNLGNPFIDHNGTKVHYEKYQDTLLDENGKDVADDVNILGDEKNE